jgi:hypothetical protein
MRAYHTSKPQRPKTAHYFLPASVDQAALPQRPWERQLHGADQPGRAVGDDQQRHVQPARFEVVEEARPRVGALIAARRQAEQDWAALGGHAPRGEHRLGGCARMHPKVRTVQEQVIQLDVAKVAPLPGVELVLDDLADPVHGRLAQRGLGTERLGQRGLDITDAQAAHKAGQHERFQRVGAGHAPAQQPGGERLARVAQLGPLQDDRAGGGLDLDRLVAVAIPRASVRVVLVAVPAQELGDLGLQRRLDHQAHAEPGSLLQGLGQRLAASKQVINLRADALGGRYSRGHGRGSPLRVVSSIGSLRPSHFSTEAGTPPTGGDGTHTVLEAVGYKEAYEQALGVVRPGGVISRVGVPQYDEAPIGFSSLFGPNLTLTGGPAPVRAYIDQLLPDVLDGTVDPGKVFDRTVSLDEVPDGYRAMDRREAIKVLIRP